MPNHQVLSITLYYVNREKHLAIVNGKSCYTDYNFNDNDGIIHIYFNLNGYSLCIDSSVNAYELHTLDEDDKSLKFILSESTKYFFFERKYMTIEDFHQFIELFNDEQLPIPFRIFVEQYFYFPDIPIGSENEDNLIE